MRSRFFGLFGLSLIALIVSACANAGDPMQDGDPPSLDDRLISAMSFDSTVEEVGSNDIEPMPQAPSDPTGYPIVGQVTLVYANVGGEFTLAAHGAKGDKGEPGGVIFKFNNSAKWVRLRGAFNPSTQQMEIKGQLAPIAELRQSTHTARVAFWVKAQSGGVIVGPYAEWTFVVN